MLDVTGGLFLVLAVLIGYLAVRKGMNIAWLLCLAMILFLNSLLDGFIARRPAVGALVGGPWYLVLGRALTVAGPVLELIGAYLSWAVYKDHIEQMPSSEAFLLPEEQVSYQATAAAQAPLARQAPPPGFAAFSGHAHRLG
ncbi:unnamed protein product [Effrenium voratum]|nr:unnamed protein product [Effrenium voratum]